MHLSTSIFKASVAIALAAALNCADLAAQSSRNMRLVGRVPFPPCTTGDVWGLGDYMLMARRSQGWAIVNLRDPANPVVKTIRPPGYPTSAGNYGVGDIKSDGRYIYCSDEGRNQGVFIYDAQQDPWNPRYVGSLGNVGRVHNFWVEGNLLVTNRGAIYDITNRAAPRRLATIPAGFAHDALVRGNRAYMSEWNNGLGIYDISNPRSPRRIGSARWPGAACHNMWPTDDGKFLFTTDENVYQGVGGFVRVWDISNLAVIRQVGQFKTGPRASVTHNVQVAGDLLFVSYYKEGVRVLSIKDPANPVEIAHYDTYAPLGAGCFGGPYAGCWGVYPWNRDHVLVSDLDSGGYILKLETIPHTFSARSTTVRRGGTIDLSLVYRNAATTQLGGFGVMILSSVNSAPVILDLYSQIQAIGGGASVTKNVQLPVPVGIPANIRVGFTAWSGHFNPLIVSERSDLTVTIQ